MGGDEVLEGLMLGPLVRSMIRRQLRAFIVEGYVDLDELERTLVLADIYLEALDALTPNRVSRPPKETDLGSYDAGRLQRGQ